MYIVAARMDDGMEGRLWGPLDMHFQPQSSRNLAEQSAKLKNGRASPKFPRPFSENLLKIFLTLYIWCGTVPIMNKFSTFDVARVFNIDRTRLQTWLDKDFFKPDRKARGKGTKAVFTLKDLYRLRLFLYALDLFGSRDRAKYFANIEFENVGPSEDEFKYYMYTLDGGEVPLGRGERLKQEPIFTMAKDKVAVVVMNLLTVKAEVDKFLRADKEALEAIAHDEP